MTAEKLAATEVDLDYAGVQNLLLYEMLYVQKVDLLVLVCKLEQVFNWQKNFLILKITM